MSDIVESLAERQRRMTPKQRALLERLLVDDASKTVAAAADSGASAAPRPLSFAQEAIWLLQQLQPDRRDYHIAAAVEMRGAIDPQAIAASLDAVCARHDVLAMRVTAVDGRGMQTAGAAPRLEIIDLSSHPREQVDDALSRIVAAAAEQPFALETGPLLRARLVVLDQRRSVLILAAHHIICDGWSIALFLGEFGRHYAAHFDGRTLSLARPPQFADHADAQRRRLTPERIESLLEYWRSALKDAPAQAAQLLANRERPRGLALRGAGRTAELSAAQWQAIVALAASLRVTPFVVLLAAVNVLVLRRTGLRDVLIGTPTAGRHSAGAMEALGLFVNAVVLRSRQKPNMSFADLIGAGAETVAGAMAHADLPFELLVRECNPSRDGRAGSLVDLSLSLQEFPVDLSLPGMETEIRPVPSGQVTIELSIVARPQRGGLTIHFDYASDLFTPGDIDDIAEHLLDILAAATRSPQCKLEELPGRAAAVVPLTQNQTLVWAGQRVVGNRPVYNQHVQVNIPGPVDHARFTAAWHAAIAECDLLRATFIERDGEVVQHLGANSEIPLEFFDLSTRPEPRAELARLLAERCGVGFDLDRCCCTAGLARLGAAEWTWWLNAHHLVIDGMSFALVFERVAAHYTNEPGRPATSFATAAQLDRLYRCSAEGQADAKWWQAFAAHPAPPPAFFGKQPERTAVQVERRVVALGAERTRQLEAVTRQPRFRSFSADGALLQLITAAVLSLLHRVSGETSLCVGLPFHNRATAAERLAVGPLMTVCPVAVEIAAGQVVSDLVTALKQQLTEVARHSRCAIANPPDRRLYHVIVNFQNVRYPAFMGRQVAVTSGGGEFSWETFSVHIERPVPDGELMLNLDFDVTTFDRAGRDRVARDLESVLAAVAIDPDISIAALPIVQPTDLPTSEASSCATERADTLVRRRAAMVPDAVALADNGKIVSYGALAGHADSVAAQLRQNGVRPGDVVAVKIERSLALVAALLGVLRADATYLPLDRESSAEVTAKTLQQSRAHFLLERGDAPSAVDLRCLCIAAAPRTAAVSPAEMPASLPAYIMQTSGSTGWPKVIPVPHAALASFVDAARSRYGLGAADRVVCFAAPSFDTSIEEIFCTLASGATLLIRPPGPMPTPTAFLAWARGEKATVLDLPTAYWHLVTAELNDLAAHLWPELRIVIIGGEAAAASAWHRWRAEAPAVRLINSYGPSETTIVVSTFASSAGEAEQQNVPIGRALPGVRLHVLGPSLEPVPGGTRGELYVGGDQLALGYGGAAHITAERFIPDPFSPIPGARLYRTGDWVRLRADGQLEFCGRGDRQVKISGVRIELENIESILLAIPGVAQAAAFAQRPAENAADRLVAIVVPAAGAKLSLAELLSVLSRRLQRGSVPSAVIVAPSLPLNDHGKIDHRALAGMIPSTVAAEPGSGLEAEVSEMAAALLGLAPSQLDRTADFFAMGGNSMLGAQLLSRLNARFGTRIELGTLFENPTLRGLAHAVAADLADSLAAGEADAFETTEGVNGDADSGAIERMMSLPTDVLRAHIARRLERQHHPIPQHSRDRDGFPLSFAQQQMWFAQALEPDNPTWNVSIAVRLDDVDPEILRWSLERLIERHEILRTRIVIAEGEPRQSIENADRISITLPVEDLAWMPAAQRDAEVNRRAREHGLEPFDLSDAPLLRACIIREAPNKSVLLLCLHHAVCDGWSAGIMFRELMAFYRAWPNDKAAGLPPLRVQYADFALWQRAAMQRGAFDAQLAYWNRKLAGLPNGAATATVRSPSASPPWTGASVFFTIEAAVYARLTAFAAARRVTLHALLVAILAALLHRQRGDTDLVIGTPVAGRDHPDLEPLIGLFVNTLALRLDVSGNPPFETLLDRARQVCREALANRDVPFDQVLHAVQPKRMSATSPLFSVMFTLLNETTRRHLVEGDIAEALLQIDRDTANRDLTFRMEPRGDKVLGHVEYRTALFERETIEALLGDFKSLIEQILVDPSIRLDSLKFDRTLKGPAAMPTDLKDLLRDKLRQVRDGKTRSPRSAASDDRQFPATVQAGRPGLDPAAWIGDHHDEIQRTLHDAGALLMRGFRLDSAEDFARASAAIEPTLMDYDEPSTPRSKVSDRIFTSTEYPADQIISLHNEMAYTSRWPLRLLLFCVQPASEGGATPIANSREVLRRLDPAIRRRFVAHGIAYQRSFGSGLDLPWQTVFGSSEPAAVERYCRDAGIAFEWRPDGRLRTVQIRPATATHPTTGAEVWFNVAHIFHVDGHEPATREALRALMNADDLPRHARFGDGSPITSEDIRHILDVYAACTVRFQWERGDLLILDNMLTAHGRDPFKGPRRILVAMGGMTS